MFSEGSSGQTAREFADPDQGGPSALKSGERRTRGANNAGADREEPNLAGQSVAEFRIDKRLAIGGMGSVYAARCIRTGERVAIKVLLSRHAADDGLRARFVREIEFLKRVAHPGIGVVKGEGRLADGRPFFAMPLYPSRTLGAEIRKRGPLAVNHAVSLTLQLLDALTALHGAGLVHRDLQPDNILLLASADPKEDPQLVLIDFGFAHPKGVDTGDGVTPESPGAMVGTLRFLAPEQITRARAITERTDLFGAAMLFYYALSGQLPFTGTDDVDALVSVLRKPPVAIRKRRRDVPGWLEPFFERALAKHPDNRFASAEEMRDALAKHL